MQHDEAAIFRDNVRKFLQRQIAPHYRSWEDSGCIPRSVWSLLGGEGLLCVDMPEQYGGLGADIGLSAVLIEEVARAGFAGLATAMLVHSDIVAPYLLHHGSEQQKQLWLPRLISGDAVGAIAMTEPGAGSDLQGMGARALAAGEGYRLSGQKTFITNGIHADLVIVAAKTDPEAGSRGISLFTVAADSPGFSKGRRLEKIGQHASDTAELFFDDVSLGPEQLLGPVGRGLHILMQELARERLLLSIAALGAADGMLERTVAYVKERRLFGSELSRLQNTRFKLAELKARLEAVRAFLRQCLADYGGAGLDNAQASIGKLLATELQVEMADQCLQLHGGYGYTTEYQISRDFLDARVQKIYGGASEVMKEIIARALLD